MAPFSSISHAIITYNFNFEAITASLASFAYLFLF